MTESSVRAFFVGMLAAWVLSFAWTRVRWWIADRAFKKLFVGKKPPLGTFERVTYPWSPTAGDAWKDPVPPPERPGEP